MANRGQSYGGARSYSQQLRSVGEEKAEEEPSGADRV